MISNTKDVWRLESKWSDHDRFWTDITTESWQRFPTFFFLISLVPTNIVVSGHTKNYGKLKEFTEKHGNLCGGERGRANIYVFVFSLILKFLFEFYSFVFTVCEQEYMNICSGLTVLSAHS